MEFSIETSEMQRAVHLLSVSAKMNTNEIEGRVLIEALEDEVIFLATDLYTAVEFKAHNVNVKSTGSTAVLYSSLKSFVNNFSPWDGDTGVKNFLFSKQGETVSIELEAFFVEGKKSKGNLNLEHFSTHTIPRPSPFNKTTFILNSSIIKTATNKVVYAINCNESKPSLQGMCLRFDNDYIYFAGTNGFVLSEYKIKNISELKNNNFIISYKFIMGLRRIIRDEDQVFFELDDRRIKAKFGSVCFWGQLIVGQEYPNYAIYFDDFSEEIVLNKEIFLSSLRPFIDLLDSEDNNRLKLKFEDQKVFLITDNAKFRCDDNIEYKENFSVDISGVFLLQTVEAIKDADIAIKFLGPNGNLIFDAGNYRDQKALVTHIRGR